MKTPIIDKQTLIKAGVQAQKEQNAVLRAADIVQECYLQCLAVEQGEGECSRAIRTKYPELVRGDE